MHPTIPAARPVRRARSLALVPGLLALASTAALGQPAVDLPRASPNASVSQTFGYTTATVTYSRPAVRKRVIWGSLVPYGQVWRAGANEATAFEITTDAKVNGQILPKGKYALYVRPEKNEWTFLFNKNPKAWGAFAYDSTMDALRIKVTPKRAEHKEHLEYSFADLTDSSATLSLHWERLKGSVGLTVEFMETAKANITKGLPKAKADDPYAWLGAARFYWNYNIDRKQALEWIDKSIAAKPIHMNLWQKAEWLAAEKRFAEAHEAARLARAEAEKDPNPKPLLAEIDKTVRKWPAAPKAPKADTAKAGAAAPAAPAAAPAKPTPPAATPATPTAPATPAVPQPGAKADTAKAPAKK